MTPLTDCRLPISSGQARLTLRNGSPDEKDRLLWKWIKGAATAKADFGIPTATTDYRLCIYDGTPTLVASATAPAGGTCGGSRPCWRDQRRGYRYTNSLLTPDGLRQVLLKSGPDRKATIIVKGSGVNLDMPPLPITHLPVIVQLVASDGRCWAATYSSTLSNQEGQFKAKAD